MSHGHGETHPADADHVHDVADDAAGDPAAAGWIEPGIWVRHPDQPDWGDGQVQSVVGARVTVNFENAGKVLINAARVALTPLDT